MFSVFTLVETIFPKNLDKNIIQECKSTQNVFV